MPKYRVTIPFPVFVSVKIEADSEEDAEDKAFEEASITGFAGNGGIDKLVGVYGPNVSIEAGDCHLDSGGFSVEVEEI